MTTPAKPRRRWLRFGLRTMLALVLLLAIPMGWVTLQLKWIRDRHEVMSRNGDRTHGWLGATSTPWGLRMLGEQGREKVFAPASELDHIQALFPESQVMTFDDRPPARPPRPTH